MTPLHQLANRVADLCDGAEASAHDRAHVSDLFLRLGLQDGPDIHRIKQIHMNRAEATVVGHLGAMEQKAWLYQVREVCRQAPLVRPTTPGGAAMQVRVSAAGRLGWTGDSAYRYSETQQDGRPWPALPDKWRQFATRVAGEHAWDSAIVNWYEPGASLGWHADKAEHDTSLPVVTVSLGDACSWAVRESEGEPVERCRLETGAVTMLAGFDRSLEHTVERIIRAPLFSPMPTPGRISVSIRVAGSPAETSQR